MQFIERGKKEGKKGEKGKGLFILVKKLSVLKHFSWASQAAIKIYSVEIRIRMLGVFLWRYILFDWVLVVLFSFSLFFFFIFFLTWIQRLSSLMLLPLFCCWFWWLINSSVVRQSPGELLRPHSPRTLARGEDKQASSTFYFHLEPLRVQGHI